LRSTNCSVSAARLPICHQIARARRSYSVSVVNLLV